MMKRIVLNIIFYGLIISTAIGVGVVYERNFVGSAGNQQPKAVFVSNQQVPQNAPTPKNTPVSTNNNQLAINNPPPISNIPPSNQNQNIPTQIPNADRCIITVFGNEYDVTDLQDTHSGGNVFNCGTDMTSVFQSRHGNNTRLIQRYLVN